MNDQLTLGESLRDEGMSRAAAAASPDWQARWDAAIAELAASGRPFTSDEVREIAGSPKDHPNAAGARFMAAKKAGLIRMTGEWRPSTRPALHGHRIGCWIGVRP